MIPVFSDEKTVRLDIESLRGPQGERGPVGQRGEQGPQGIAGAKGERGVGITKVLRTAGDGSPGTFDEYTTYYDDGAASIHLVYNGANGHTPVKGEDYWTEADKQSMVSDVLAALPSAEGVSY